MALRTEGPAPGTESRRRDAATVRSDVREWRDGAWSVREDVLTAEEPLEIRVAHAGAKVPVAVTMRTPGDDVALAAGFLLSEGIIEDAEDLVGVEARPGVAPDGALVSNVVVATLRPGLDFDAGRLSRNVYTTASCGVCGKATLDALDVACRPIAPGRPEVLASTLQRLPAVLRAEQGVFAATGGVHATLLATAEGEVLEVAEDVGRHNATDKVLGRALLASRLPLSDHVIVVSGRASFEIVQKAARAGVPVVAAVGAPSSLAVDAARRFGLTLVGFLSEGRFNAYTGVGRIRGLTCAPRRPAP